MKKHLRFVRKLMLANSEAERRRAIRSSEELVDDRLVLAIRDQCYLDWSSRPENVRKAAAALRSLKKEIDSPIVYPTWLWVEAIADITLGAFARAESRLAEAAEHLRKLGRDLEAAQVQVAQLFALAMLGRYEEAYHTGRKAIRIFLKHADLLAAGKAELNLSNLFARQGKHKEALKYCASAAKRFLEANSPSWYVMAENGLANTYADINQLDKAQYYYERALATAKAEGMEVTIAEIEACIGGVAVNRGQYSSALRFLETSRQRYESLKMPHQSAIADLEMSDIYFELNLIGPAADILAKLGDRFKRLKMRVEEARSRLLYGRVLAIAHESKAAKRQFRAARRLFAREYNVSGEVSALLELAGIELNDGNTGKAASILHEAEPLLKLSEDPRQSIFFQETEGRMLLQKEDVLAAKSRFRSALKTARKHRQIDSERSILSRLGSLSSRLNRVEEAKRFLIRAIALTEQLHSNVAVDEFGIAFLGSRVSHYQDLTRLLIQQRRISRSFEIIERGRSRSLLMSLERRSKTVKGPARLEAQTAGLRTELNQYYRALGHSSSVDFSSLNEKIRFTERKLSENERILSSLRADNIRAEKRSEELDLEELRNEMRDGRSLVEFIEIDGQFSAYVIAGGKIKFFPSITTASSIGRLLEDLHFQFSTQRYRDIGRFSSQIRQRTDSVLNALYDQIISPIVSELPAADSLVLIPAGNLHYVPFAALFDGTRYLVEQSEIVLSPSAAIWQKLNARRVRSPSTALIMGVSDETIPLAEHEAASIGTAFRDAKILIGADASFENFRRSAASADVIHLACHGEFRPDNPMFSSLRLADGWITVGDLTSLRLKASLVALSACETGLSEVYPGDELLGLVRGFIAAGAANVVVSLWNLNDEAASELMRVFYAELLRGATVPAALRQTQITGIKQGLDPYRWAPLFAMGR